MQNEVNRHKQLITIQEPQEKLFLMSRKNQKMLT